MTDQKLLITIEGPSNSGKSAILQLISTHLSYCGLNATISMDSQTLREGSFREVEELHEVIESLVNNNVKIVITDKHQLKNGEI